MEQLNRIQELDKVLEIVIDFGKTSELAVAFINEAQIRTSLKQKGYSIHGDYLTAILLKLIKDGYVSNDKKLIQGKEIRSFAVGNNGEKSETYSTIKLDELGVDFYFPTWEGILFSEQEGYTKKEAMFLTVNQRIERLESNTYLATVWVAVATVALVIFELVKFLLPIYSAWYRECCK